MKNWIILTGLCALGALSGASFAASVSPLEWSATMANFPQGNATEGSAIHAARFCAGCHGAQGLAPAPNWPHVAGQPAEVTIKSLLDYRNGRRKGDAQAVMMAGMALSLSDQNIADLAAHYAALSAPPADAAAEHKLDPAALKLVHKGDRARMITPCAACHGINAQGNANGKVPVLHGQTQPYLAASLKAYRSGARDSDMLEEMRFFARALTDAEIEALSNYYAGLGVVSAPKQEKTP